MGADGIGNWGSFSSFPAFFHEKKRPCGYKVSLCFKFSYLVLALSPNIPFCPFYGVSRMREFALLHRYDSVAEVYHFPQALATKDLYSSSLKYFIQKISSYFSLFRIFYHNNYRNKNTERNLVMKKYNIVWKLWTGNWYLDGKREYGDELKVRTNNINYIFLARDKYFSEIDIYTGKVDLYDLQTQKPLSYNDLLNS